MKTIELLAPAGTLECGLAAFQYGADAVYLGMKLFSARADAGNFSLEDLRTLLGVAHPRRKVYVAVNTLVREEELPALVRLLCDLRGLEVDGLIVQDAALLGLIREHFPEFELHASTQMALHNVEGVREAKRLGYARIVAARELTIPELADMSAVPGMEVEAFIHGALCYSYSGLCLLSACLNGTSGNRGECSYVCRGRFRIKDARGNDRGMCCPFSMKDLATGDLLQQLRKAGVASLKIEGRKKTPLYVAAVTNYYRKLLDGTFKPGEEQQAASDVKTIFSRPWTHFFLDNVRNTGITDIETLGPRGTEVGYVAKVKEGYLRFVVKKQAIEKHDGLQVEIPGVSRPFGFGIEEIHAFTQAGNDRWSRVFVAQPGTTVEVPLPPGAPDMPVGSRICCTSSNAVRRRYHWDEARPALWRQRLGVDFNIEIAKSKISACAWTKYGICKNVSLETEPLSPARDIAVVEAQARDAFSRLGDTGLQLGDFQLQNPDRLFVPKSLLNELRRRVADEVQAALDIEREGYCAKVLERTKPAIVESKTAAPKLSVKIDRAYFLNMLDADTLAGLEEVVFALDKARPEELDSVLGNLAEKLGGRERIRLALPVIVRPAARHDYAPLAKKLAKAGWHKWEIGNLGGFDVFQGMDVDLTADWSLYAFNHIAAGEWLKMGARRVTFCPEDTEENQEQLAQLLGDKVTAVLYQEPVLARSAVCAMASMNGSCLGMKECDYTELDLTSTKNEHLIAVNDKCTTVLLGDAIDRCHLLSHYHALGIRHFRADFLWRNYSPAAIKAIVDKIKAQL
ncbi:MAG: U32 family peptidase [Victivallales bacterium]|nr:U32 family peptidase [Victivallales bacterium]